MATLGLTVVSEPTGPLFLSSFFILFRGVACIANDKNVFNNLLPKDHFCTATSFIHSFIYSFLLRILSYVCRDRIIHLLALRSYKKPELLLRLQRDGIKEKDKGSLGAVLNQLATLGRDNAYVLAKHAFHDVRHDWPFYSPADRALLKRCTHRRFTDFHCSCI